MKKARKPRPSDIAVEVIEKEATQYIEECYRDYGIFTLEDRALPDFRDGLLKVYRRTLWSMYHIAPSNKPHVKTARVSGDVIGKYHPHGNAAVDAAIETMVNMPCPMADGLGNWGGQTDNAAASRYTNVRMSTYAAACLADERYTPVMQYTPNYDGKDKEPVLLPALLPNVLINGVQGIAVGLAASLPSFQPEGLVKLIKGMLQGKKLTAAIVKKTLQPAFSYGGYCPFDADWQTGADSIIKDGKGSLYVYCEYDFETKGELNITAVPPRMTYDTLINRLVDSGYFTHVADVMGKNTETPAHIQCRIKRGVRMNELEEWCDNNLYSTVPYQIAVVERYWDENENKIRATAHQWGIITLLEKWLEWRVSLEKDMLTNQVSILNKQIDRKNLLLLAQQNRKTIAKSWEAQNAVDFLVGNIEGISEEEAKEILSLRIQQLTKLDRDKLQEEIKQLKAEIKQVKTLQANPESSVLSGLSSLSI